MKKLLLCLFLLLHVTGAEAFILEPYVFTSYGEASHPNESESPKMFGHGVGASLLFSVLPLVYFGGSAEYRFYNQSSEVKDPYGNRTGKRMAISPTLGIKLGPVFFKYSYHMLGDYELDNKTSSDTEVKYSDVSGHSFWLSVPVAPMLRVGAFYELESFSTTENGSVETDLSTNNNELEFNKYGLYLSILI